MTDIDEVEQATGTRMVAGRKWQYRLKSVFMGQTDRPNRANAALAEAYALILRLVEERDTRTESGRIGQSASVPSRGQGGGDGADAQVGVHQLRRGAPGYRGRGQLRHVACRPQGQCWR